MAQEKRVTKAIYMKVKLVEEIKKIANKENRPFARQVETMLEEWVQQKHSKEASA